MFRAGDGSVFYVGAHADSLGSISVVQWRGVELCCPSCFLEQLDDEERKDLAIQLRSGAARKM